MVPRLDALNRVVGQQWIHPQLCDRIADGGDGEEDERARRKQNGDAQEQAPHDEADHVTLTLRKTSASAEVQSRFDSLIA